MILLVKWAVTKGNGDNVARAMKREDAPFVCSWGDGDEQWMGWDASEGVLSVEYGVSFDTVVYSARVSPEDARLWNGAVDPWLSPTPLHEYDIDGGDSSTFNLSTGNHLGGDAAEWGML